MAVIAVLDDVLDAAVMVQRILGRQGHTVHPFTEEDEFFAFVQESQVDLAILDIKLKKLSGIEVLEETKKAVPAIRILMLTGYPTLETAQRALQLGADDYLVKPIDKHELEEKVAQSLASKSSGSE
ncbi:MAG: response regulator [Desulfohalobiaceae bacterium]